MTFQAIDTLAINTIRTLAIDAIQKANSGHPGLPLGAAPMAYVLWKRHLKHNPLNPRWQDRDRFVLSAGHGSMLLYPLLHLTGYRSMTLEQLQNFRQWESQTPGHPETFQTEGVEATTGPLGQGSANVVGMAIAERALAAMFNRPGHEIVNHYTYGLVSDGDLMEGISAEAASLAAHLGLGKLIYLYDSNDITLDGPTSMAFSTENVAKRYESYGWQVLTVADGDEDFAAIDRAIAEARADTKRPSLIIVKTTIGFGSPNKAGSSEAHGSPLGPEEVALTKKALGWDPEKKFHVPSEVTAHLRDASVEAGKKAEADWNARFERYSKEHPELAKLWQQAWEGKLPAGWEKSLPTFKAGEKIATRKAGGGALNAVAAAAPWFIGGDADLGCSTGTVIKGAESFLPLDGKPNGRNIHFGVREHAMAAIANGMSYHGGVRPFTATFFVFSDYMRPSVRLAAMNDLSVIHIWTHDSVALGEDGPTHQPVEHLMSLRAMPGLTVIRPCDANETAQAWKVAIEKLDGPVGLVLSRQNLPVLERGGASEDAANVARGAYVIREAEGGKPDAVIIATGSEVHPAVEARDLLASDGIRARVVSMPSWELFEKQDGAYRASVIPRDVRARVAVEAGATLGWERYVGDHGAVIGLDRYGASAPGEVLLEKFGFTAENIAKTVRSLVKK